MSFWPFNLLPTSGSPKAQSAGRVQELLIVCHGDDLQGLSIMENICTNLVFAKIPFSLLDLAHQDHWPKLERFSSITICTERIDAANANAATDLRQYIDGGGGLFVAYRCWNQHLADLFGLRDWARPAIHVTEGLAILREVLPGAMGLRLETSDWLFENSRFDLSVSNLMPDCTILATDVEDRPLAWRRNIGAGRLVYWNTGILSSRAMRGFAHHALLESMGIGVAATGGFAMFHIDDFPPSTSSASAEPVASEFAGIGNNGFLFDIWRNDLMTLKRKHDLKFTWYTVMNYFDVDVAENARSDTHAAATGADVLRDRFARIGSIEPDDELGFHGYNHVPLTREEWPHMETVRVKLLLARKLWEEVVPDEMPRSWAPVNNWFHPEHLQAISEIFPEITTVCTSFSSGEFETGEYREFGPEPWRSSLLCLPRETYGYVRDPVPTLLMISQIAAMGVWTHFIHPDDIFDIPTQNNANQYTRNPKKLFWRATNNSGHEGLFVHLDNWLAHVRQLYPWIEFVTTTQAEQLYRKHSDNPSVVTVGKDTIEIRSSTEQFYLVRTPANGRIRTTGAGATIEQRLVDNGVLHVVKCAPGNTIIHLS